MQLARGRSGGFVEPLALYTLSEACARMGWSQSAFAAAQNRGLTVLRAGKRGYLRGEELIRFIESQKETTPV